MSLSFEEPPQFNSPEEQNAYMLATLSEGICPCCRTKLDRERTCGMGYTWDIKCGVITSGPEGPRLPNPSYNGRPSGSYGLMQVMSTETNYKPLYDYNPLANYKVAVQYSQKLGADSGWYGKIETDYYNEANLTGEKSTFDGYDK